MFKEFIIFMDALYTKESIEDESMVYMADLSAEERMTIHNQDYYYPEYDFENEVIKP